jgi:hypothetical protein
MEETQGPLIKISGPAAHEVISVVETLKRSGVNVELEQTSGEASQGEASRYRVSGATEAELTSIAEVMQRSGVDVEIAVSKP